MCSISSFAACRKGQDCPIRSIINFIQSSNGHFLQLKDDKTKGWLDCSSLLAARANYTEAVSDVKDFKEEQTVWVQLVGSQLAQQPRIE
jgi:hypothetical protein